MAKKTGDKVIASNLTQLQNNLAKRIGEGSLMIGRSSIVQVEAIPTNVASIDIACGCGGLPRGRIIEVYGPESSGKTTTCLQFAKACQQYHFKDTDRDGVVAFIDAEHALDINWAARMGVDIDNILISQPDSGEDAFTILEQIAESGLVDLVIVDSVASLVPESEIQGEIGDVTIGAQARLMSASLRKLKGTFNKTKTTVVFINQIREKIGVSYGNPESTPGGRALKFYASMRMDIRAQGKLSVGDLAVATNVKLKIVKNKVAPPFTIAEYKIGYGLDEYPISGIDEIGTLFDSALANNIITKKGSFFKFGEHALGNGVVNSIQTIRSNEKILNGIKDKIYSNTTPKVEHSDDGDGEMILDELGDEDE